MASKKRPREDGGDARAPQAAAAAAAPATIGQQTSHIKNKLARSEMYAKLKHKQKVRRWCLLIASAASIVAWGAQLLCVAYCSHACCGCILSVIQPLQASNAALEHT